MNLLFDTNILINLVKDTSFHLLERLNPGKQKVFVSVVTIGELKSISLQNNWGLRRLEALEVLMSGMIVLEISENLVDTFAQIDAFSQHRNPLFADYTFKTARNMGKNDLWIAATAALLGLKLVTTDGDFDHLHEVFFDVWRFKPSDLH